jgi:hypothetical protein
MSPAVRLGRLLSGGARGVDELPTEFFHLTDEDRRYLTTLYDDSVPLPASASQELVSSNPRLEELQAAYAELDLPVLTASRWGRDAVQSFLDLRWFRGETLITWHYRELPRITALKYFIFMQYVRAHDPLGLLDRLDEDGAFGCWTYDYPAYGRVSRDLLESVIEISFLDSELHLSKRDRFSILDIGAGYGRLAHRMVKAFPGLIDYCCTDVIPECTLISEYYLRYRDCLPRARVVPLTRLASELQRGSFDVAVNIHSFSECPLAAIDWWIKLVRELEVPYVLVVPNESTELLSLELDGTRRPFVSLLERAGYRLATRRPVVEDPAVRQLLRLEDHFHLFRLESTAT